MCAPEVPHGPPQHWVSSGRLPWGRAGFRTYQRASVHHLEVPVAPSPSGPLLTVRATVVLLLALITGVLAGVLAYLGDHALPAAVLVGGGAAGAAVLLFHAVIGR